MSTESALHDSPAGSNAYVSQADKERMLGYKAWAAAFSYPDDAFFAHLPQLAEQRQSLVGEYDRLFRAGLVWLYGAEHLVKNEFQRANLLSDIMGFYTAFGLEPDLERPDSITCEMDFMHYLIFKRDRLGSGAVDDARDKADICRDAEKKFFIEHLEPAATPIAREILAQTKHPFYKQAAEGLLEFLSCEREHFGSASDAGSQ
ncbi:MAG: TorD/DmsD family molecular chaperone [Planctomycetota bacterium]